MVYRPLTRDDDPLAAVQAILRRYPHAPCESSSRHVAVPPLDDEGYAVEFVVAEGRPRGTPRFAVNCDGWHKEFRELEEALSCFTAALSTSTRLEVWLRGSTPYKWILQNWVRQRWQNVSAVGAWLVPFWRRRRIVHLQNHLLEAA